ncbi:Ppx/GppA family phosphatase [Allopusillimonas soli]|uniref:Ppx/GppA family phosphatase n=1 Tax=Allopusillimonas soli TaxID=659016 RepID=A0A853FFZ8_9BURK|nr:Ppx/GppA phosphatase family protein [Allopusillimonas soli]NYT38582.1 Ppx/GppA family phosphatase [Allopusillimonas soli]TEA71703.1 Ppx/GppA family phosphatase [Allopusillimonas soli]
MDQLLAAVDLGSNSFRLSIGKVVQQDGVAQIYAVDRLKESVRLAAGLDDRHNIDQAATERAITVLKRFGELLSGFHPNRVRAVATNTFRVARNASDIVQQCEQALGFPIEIIAGQEEARLIFSGISNELPPSPNRRLMIDIGGGSTEVIIGKGFQPIHLSSLFMGCVSYTKRFFPDGRITATRMAQAQLAARGEFERISRLYRQTGWQEAYGSSGTAKGLIAVLQEGGLSRKGITLEGLEKLKAKLIQDGRVIMSELPGLKHDRSLVLAGGLAIMLSAFQELKIKAMAPGEGALRVGVLYDLLGRDSDHDKRHETVRQFIKRYHVDTNQSERVRRIALDFFKQLGLEDTPENQELERALGWAADLHEVGLSIAHDDYHKHGAYILEHADMPGFSNDDQLLLARLVLGHQGKMSKLRGLDITRATWRALLCLRLAVLLSRRRENQERVPVSLRTDGHLVEARVDEAWLEARPLSEFLLKSEEKEWRKVGTLFRLKQA